jgi:hypothetical protein
LTRGFITPKAVLIMIVTKAPCIILPIFVHFFAPWIADGTKVAGASSAWTIIKKKKKTS